MKARPEVAIIGPYPPPAGGISVHVERLAALLADHFRVVVVDPYRREQCGAPAFVKPAGRWAALSGQHAAYVIRRQAADLVHVHVSSMGRFATGGWPMLASLPGKSRRVLTIHSGSFAREVRSAGRLHAKLIQSIVCRFDHVIAVNTEICSQLLDFGVSPDAVSVLPAYLPPPVPSLAAGRERLAPLLHGGRQVLVTSGYGIREYGLHVIARALRESPDLQARFSLALCLYNTYDEGYVAEVGKLLEGLPAVAMFRDLNATEFSEVLAAGDIYVRATAFDGDAVAVREGLYFGKPVVASDAAERPPGCFLFKAGSAEALAIQLRELTGPRSLGIAKAQAGEVPVGTYAEIYRQCLGGGCTR